MTTEGPLTARAPMADPGRARAAARAIAAAALGRDPGPMATAASGSHHVYGGPDVVVKIIDAASHTRLNREIALAPHLPAGLTAPLLDSGTHRLETGDVRFACYARVPGTAPSMGMPGVDGATARALAEQAVERLGRLHAWVPQGEADRTLRETLDHGGFTGRAAFLAEIEGLAERDRHGTVPTHLLDGLRAIARDAPPHARTAVPVHADCHWDNWLAHAGNVTALLDFEWARFGDPVDDWFFLIRFSGPHMETLLDVVARATGTPPDTLRAGCEVREATHLAADLRVVLERPEVHARMAADRLRSLEELVVGRYWWRDAR
ncbi:phosphotransferase family protein [Streptomyces sp. NBC_01264]|uniref:phosphotransferase family protein n=1 Tax=Streptomyces sp. NBC_01264 TaxID=2903804 RepID=UPI0022573BFF|nr:phosphotransferase [Streptomyces sp. NBC_01264]MCX4782358.1 phosphotransferase [Streptomyces sp. NBC_01264]